MNKFKTFIPIFVFVSLVFLLQSSLTFKQEEKFKEVTEIPSFNLEAFPGKEELTNEIFKGKVSLLNVWASWCSTCIQEHDMLFNVKDSTKLQVIGVAFNDEESDITNFFEKYGNPFDIIMNDYKGSILVNLGLRSIPITFLIDDEGNVTKSHLGRLTIEVWKKEFLPLIEKELILF